MGLLESVVGSRIYLDANIWIYALEDFSQYREPIHDLFEATDAGRLTIVTSELTLAEILVKPNREDDSDKQSTYIQLVVDTRNAIALPINRGVLLQAAKVRATTKLKLPDAIHAASSTIAKCTTFLTNDKQFRTVPGLNTVLLSQGVQSAKVSETAIQQDSTDNTIQP